MLRNNWIEIARTHPRRNCSRKNMSEYVRVLWPASPKKERFVLYTCYAPPASLLASLSLFVSFRSRFSSPRDQRANMISLSFSFSAAPYSETRVRHDVTQRLNGKRKNARARASG